MGKSAKLTRGGNKLRQNVGRQEAKLKAMGVDPRRAHGTMVGAKKGDSAEAAKLAAAKQSIAAKLKQLQQQDVQPAAKMMKRPTSSPAAAKQRPQPQPPATLEQ